jgi:hypothetical protein
MQQPCQDTYVESLLSEAELRRTCGIAGGWGLRPHPTQSMPSVPALVQACWESETPLFRRGRRGLVLLALDGLVLAAAHHLWTPSFVVPLTSTFPSNSVTAWLSAVTGLTPGDHGVPGPVYWIGDDRVYVVFQNRTVGWNESQASAEEVSIGPWPTLFADLARRGADVEAHIGDLVNLPGPWVRALFHDAHVVRPSVDWNSIRYEPRAIVSAVTQEVESALKAAGPSGRPLFVWAHVNVDMYVHANGYDEYYSDALTVLEASIQAWVSSGFTVIVHADHGLVPTSSPEWMIDVWDRVNVPALCRVPSGGAGRVRWLYPRPEHEGAVFDAATRLGDDVLVVHRDELSRLGLVDAGRPITSAIGEVVAIAKGEEFPLPNPRYRYEHGSITPEEMLVPFAVWSGPLGS